MDIKSLNECHLIYLGKEVSLIDQRHINKTIESQKSFTVSRDNMNSSISLINIKIKNETLKFDANTTLLNQRKIRLSSKILRLADKVY